jgi:hypothetical protein
MYRLGLAGPFISGSDLATLQRTRSTQSAGVINEDFLLRDLRASDVGDIRTRECHG